MSKVAIIKCDSYDYSKVKKAVDRGIDLIGGANQFAKPSERILLKPNLLATDPPEKCSTTNPAVFKAVAEALKATGATITYGDSPAFHSPIAAAKAAGLYEVANALDIKLADFKNGEVIFYKEGSQNKKFFIAKGVLDSDGIVSLPKLKTHGFARMTGCIKNQFGCIPGKLKGEMHVKLPNILDFSRMLVDLNHYVNPRLYVMDGIIAMEGNGPRGGNPKPMNVLLFSSDPVALDATVCRIVDLNPEFVPTTKIGQEVGMGTYLEDEIELVGDNIDLFIEKNFNVVKEDVKPFKQSRGSRLISNLLVPKPYIIEDKCVKCGVCVNMCPINPKAIDWNNNNKKQPPIYNYDNCIRCYCCQELCPESAIKLRVPHLRRLLGHKSTHSN